ncbi:hypothetical protein D3C80_1532260 [compost metagenome]
MQRAQPTGEQQGNGDQAHHAGPENPLPDRSLVGTPGSQGIYHHRPRIRGSDEEHYHHGHRDKRQDIREREVFQEVEQCQCYVILHRVSQIARTFGHDQINGAITEHGHPQ